MLEKFIVFLVRNNIGRLGAGISALLAGGSVPDNDRAFLDAAAQELLNLAAHDPYGYTPQPEFPRFGDANAATDVADPSVIDISKTDEE